MVWYQLSKAINDKPFRHFKPRNIDNMNLLVDNYKHSYLEIIPLVVQELLAGHESRLDLGNPRARVCQPVGDTGVYLGSISFLAFLFAGLSGSSSGGSRDSSVTRPTTKIGVRRRRPTRQRRRRPQAAGSHARLPLHRRRDCHSQAEDIEAKVYRKLLL